MVRNSRAIEGSSVLSRIRRSVFGDRIGEIAFLAAVVLFAIFWVVGWRINDSITLLNGLEALGEGRLHMTDAVYGTDLDTPGVSESDGRLYARNYGILVLALVPMLVIEAVGSVADLGIVLPGLWSLAVLALALAVGKVAGHRRWAVRIGGVLALGLFAANVVLAVDLGADRAALYALQLTHLVVAALGVVFTYRILARIHDVRLGAVGASLVGLATPIGLWATIPKRHVVTATVVLVVAYALLRSRSTSSQRASLAYRAGAYGLVGLFAWVVAPEALLVFLLLAAVDVPTADRYDVRSWLAIGLTVAVSLVPFAVTNYLIAGSPVRPPRMQLRSGGALSDAAGGGGGGGGLLPGPIDSLVTPFRALGGLVGDGMVTLVTAPAELLPVFVRSGTVESVTRQAVGVSVNLSLLEASPVLILCLGVVPAGIAWGRRTSFGSLRFDLSARRIVDWFLASFAVFLTLIYVPALPLHAQITVRYLFPVVPVLVVLTLRLPAIRSTLTNHWRAYAWTVAGGVLVGGQLLIVSLVALDPRLSEAFQFHALVSLGTAVPLAGWTLVGRSEGRYGTAGAVLIGLATAAATVFVLLVTLDYFAFGNQQALPIVRVIGEIVSIV